MTDIHLTEDEQVEALKNWWKENGKAILVGVVLGAAIVASFIFWRDFKHERSETASLTYSEFAEAVQNNKDEVIKNTLQKLQNDFQATPYAALAALTMAKRSVEAENYTEAEQYLNWAVKNATHDSINQLAQVRLARVLIQQNKIDETLKILEAAHDPAFEVEFAVVRGDAYKIQGNNDKAREAYTQALNDAGMQGQRRQLLEMKRDDLLTANAGITAVETVPVNTTEKK